MGAVLQCSVMKIIPWLSATLFAVLVSRTFLDRHPASLFPPRFRHSCLRSSSRLLTADGRRQTNRVLNSPGAIERSVCDDMGRSAVLHAVLGVGNPPAHAYSEFISIRSDGQRRLNRRFYRRFVPNLALKFNSCNITRPS